MPPTPPQSDSSGAFQRPEDGAKGWGLGLILPIIVIGALLVIGYLTFGTPKAQHAATVNGQTESGSTSTTTAPGEQTTASGRLIGNRRAVDDASDAADVASGRTLGSPVYVSATALDTAFFTNPSEAALRYPAPLRVSGIVSAPVQTGPTPSVFVEGRTRLNSMIVDFPAGYEDHLASIYKGKSISVACDGVKSLGGTTILTGCLLI